MKRPTASRWLLLMLFVATVVASCKDTGTVNSNQCELDATTWKQSGLDSLRITALASDPAGTVFAGSCGEGVFRSTDHGDTWDFFAPFCVVSIAINSQGDIFASINQAFTTQLVRSADNGVSWQTLDVAPWVNLKPIVFSPSGDIFAGSRTSDESRGGIYRSTDNGNTWAQTSFPDTLDGSPLVINSQGHLFAGNGLGVFSSKDNGATWQQFNHGFEELLYTYVDALAIHPLTGEIFAALGGDGVYRLRSDEEGWVRTSLTAPSIRTLIFNDKGDIVAGGRRIPSDPGGVYCSRDNGENWTTINSGLSNRDVFALAIDTSGFLYVGSSFPTGVFRTVSSSLQCNLPRNQVKID